MADELMSLSLESLVPNPANRPISRLQLDQMKGSLSEIGQLQPIKVTPVEQGKYLILGGHIRYFSALELGWKNLQAMVRQAEPEAVNLQAAMDNRHSELHWTEWYQDVHKVSSERPDMSLRQLARLLGEDFSHVGRALKAVRILKPGTLKAISRVRLEEGYNLPEEGLFNILTLAVNEDEAEREMVDRAVAKALEGRMGGAAIKTMVASLKNGGQARSKPIPQPKSISKPIKEAISQAVQPVKTMLFERVWKIIWSLLTLIFLFVALRYSQKSSIQVHVKDLPQLPKIDFNPQRGDARE